MVVENKKLKDKIFVGIIVGLVLVIIGLLFMNFENKNQLSSDTKNINATTTSKKLVSNVNFSTLNTCATGNGNKIMSNKGAILYNCVAEYNLHGTGKSMQDFAVTDNYIYFSSPLEGAWSTYEQVISKEYQRITKTYIVRVPRQDTKYSVMYINYGGHGQSFDVAMSKDRNNKNVDSLFGNAFAYMHKTNLNGKQVYGGNHMGIYYTTFKENNSQNGTLRVPGLSIALSNSGKTLTTVKSENYLKNNKFDSDSYYKDIQSITKKLIATNTGQIINPEVAVDEDRDRLAVVSGKKAYIYDLSDFKKGKATIYNTFNISESIQGVELYGNSLYIYSGGVEQPISLTRYNITSGKKVKEVKFDLKSYYTNRPIPRYSWEAEGISIYKGKIYVGVVNRKCVLENKSKVNKTCVKSETYNEIFEIDNF